MKSIIIFLSLIVTSSLWIASCGKSGDEHAEHAMQKEMYTCPMHPEVVSDRPGVCSICHMDLVKKTASAEPKMQDMPGMIRLSSFEQTLANVATVRVEKEPFVRSINAYSYMDYAEPNRKLVTARFNGRIEKLLVDKTGDYVRKGQPLFEVYSPDLVQAQSEFLVAVSQSSLASLEGGGNTLVAPARKKLELMGITGDQIDELEKTGQIQYTLLYHSPIGGTVIEKKLQEGQYVNEGDVLFEITDLSVLWNMAEIYDKDQSMVRPGDPVTLRLPAFPDREFEGRVTFVYPVVNPQTRTVKIRSEFSNFHQLLKPQMYGELVFQKALGKVLSIPATAVLFTGKRQVAWVKTAEGQFESRNITLGEKTNGKYHVLSGLNEGDEVAVSGGFLIDSESQLKSGASSGHQHGDMKMDDGQNESEHKHLEGAMNP
jgi:Cu(I)/Ag(I) efflux system membrane fusion protein